MDSCKIFKKNVTYVEYARSGVEYYTKDLEEYKELCDFGWNGNKCRDGFRITPPEVSLIDLTDYKKANQYQNLYFNLVYYKYLKKLIKNNILNNYINEILDRKKVQYQNFTYLVSAGPVLEAEIRILGSDKRIKNLKADMVQKFIDLIWNNLDSKENDWVYKLNCTNIELKEKTTLEQMFFSDLQSHISLISNKKVYENKIYDIYNRNLIENLDVDVIVFLPFGCFKYLSSFVNDKNINKIMFWEIHAEKGKESTFKLYKKNLNNKKVLLIDNMYSGKTMKIIKKLVEDEGGIPIVLGLNPKNKNNIINSDYVMVLNTIYKSEDLDISNPQFFEDIYINTLKEGKYVKNK